MDLLPACAAAVSSPGFSPGWDHPPRPSRRSKRKSDTSAPADVVREVDSNAAAESSARADARTLADLAPDLRTYITPGEADIRHGSWWARRLKTLAGMRAAGYPIGRLERFWNCGCFARVKQNADTGDLKLHCSCCHDRFCAPCNRAKALNIADNLAARIKNDRKFYVHGVVTLKHNTAPLGTQVDRLLDCFRRLRNRRFFRNHVTGGTFFPQMHISERDGLWHVHGHFIAQARWLDKFELASEWKKITGDSDNVDVSRVDDADAAVREVCRYAAKPIDAKILSLPDSLAELMRALTGRHLCFTFGNWRKYKLTARKKDEHPERWTDLGPLAEWIARAGSGEEHAKHVLAILQRRSHPPTGPPALFPDHLCPTR